MSVRATNSFSTLSGRADEFVETLSRAAAETLKHPGCEEICIWRDLDDPNGVISVLQWQTRGHYEAYLEWRQGTGDTAMFAKMLSRPMEVRFYDEVFVAAGEQEPAR